MPTTLSPQRRDRLLHQFLRLASLLTGGILLGIIVVTVAGSLPVIEQLLTSLSSTQWAPQQGQFGMAAMLVGSLAVSLLAIAIAAPLGVLLAAWLHLYASPRLGSWLRSLYELLAGIPSVVYGLWGLIALVPLINRFAPPGASLLAAGLVLALMILPYAVLITDAQLGQVPRRQQQAALALGLSRWGTFRNVLWPYARRGALRGIVIQYGRALGETMAVLMVAGNVVRMPDSLFSPVRTLTANIALEMSYAGSEHRAALFMSGLLLMLLTLFIMVLFRDKTSAAGAP